VSGIHDLASYLRPGSLSIAALVDHVRYGTQLPDGFFESADESAQVLPQVPGSRQTATQIGRVEE